jgi:4'-phosphopantetheinyl transferase
MLRYGEHGKPYLTDNSMFFNISHSGEYVILAVSEHEVGADIERIRPYKQSVAARCFTPREREFLKDEGTDEAFYRVWTAKESIVKACGAGLSMPLNSFCVMPPDTSPHIIDGREWYLNYFKHDTYIITSACYNIGGVASIYDFSLVCN